MGIRSAAKRLADYIALALLLLPAVTCWIEAATSAQGESAFAFWAQGTALIPGPFGVLARRAFYRLTLDHCAASFHVGFGAIFTHRDSIIEEGAYIGAYTLIGSARLSRGCLIGSRASLLSGANLHQINERGEWLPADHSKRQQIAIGPHAWLGEGAVVMADVGSGAMVAAGAVVSAPVPDGIVVAGNPARFVRRLIVPTDRES